MVPSIACHDIVMHMHIYLQGTLIDDTLLCALSFLCTISFFLSSQDFAMSDASDDSDCLVPDAEEGSNHSLLHAICLSLICHFPCLHRASYRSSSIITVACIAFQPSALPLSAHGTALDAKGAQCHNIAPEQEELLDNILMCFVCY